MKKRLQKVLAEAGVASRRKCEELIASGHVKVNGAVITQMGLVVDDASDTVEVDGATLARPDRHVYLIMNKPANTLTTCSDDRGRRTVLDIIPDMGLRVFPVGRLDYDTEGLLILTNDGDFAYTISHPSSNITKTYLAYIDKSLEYDDLCALENGVFIDGRLTSKARVHPFPMDSRVPAYTVEIHEGRNRQVKKMFEAVGRKVIYLKRIAIGKLSLGGLKSGEYREMTPDEVHYFQNHGGN